VHCCKKLHEGLWRFQDSGSFQLNPLVTTGRFRILRRIVTIEIRGYKQIALEYACFESFPFREKLFIFVCQTMWFWWNVRHWTSGVNVHNENPNR